MPVIDKESGLTEAEQLIANKIVEINYLFHKLPVQVLSRNISL